MLVMDVRSGSRTKRGEMRPVSGERKVKTSAFLPYKLNEDRRGLGRKEIQ